MDATSFIKYGLNRAWDTCKIIPTKQANLIGVAEGQIFFEKNRKFHVEKCNFLTKSNRKSNPRKSKGNYSIFKSKRLLVIFEEK